MGAAFGGASADEGNDMMMPLTKAMHLESNECTKDRQEVSAFCMGFFAFDLLHNGGTALGIREGKDKSGPLRAVVVFREYDQRKEERLPKWARKVASLITNLRAYVTMKGDPEGLPHLFSDKAKIRAFEKASKEMEPLDALLHTWHKEYGPKGRHWYVGIVASDPETQGRGYCREVMDLLTRAADESGMPCYLESAERERRYYEKFGFKTVNETTIRLGEGEFACDLDGCLMTRYPTNVTSKI